MKRRIRRKRKYARKNNFIILSAISILLIMTAGYAAFNTNLNITAKGNIKVKTLTTDNLKDLVVTTGDGLYSDDYEEGRYVYRGKQPNNWLKLEDELYRIISLEADGTIKVIKNISIGGLFFDDRNIRSTGYCAYNMLQCNAWMATNNYVNGNYNGAVDKDATLNTYLNNEFYNSLNSDLKSIIEYHTYNVGSAGNEMKLEELLISEEKLKWQGYIGLISVSDYINGNNKVETCNNVINYNNNFEMCNDSNWIYYIIINNKNKAAWTITPSILTTSHLYVLNMENKISNTTGSAHHSKYGYSDIDVFPSFYISSKVLLKGKGSEQEPYEIIN